MHTEPINTRGGDIPPFIDKLRRNGFDIRYDTEQEMAFIIRLSDGAAVWGDQVGGRVILYEENQATEFSLSQLHTFEQAFDEIHTRLNVGGFDCWDEAPKRERN